MKEKYYQRVEIEAVRFIPTSLWPSDVIAWHDLVPRDMSFGYVICPVTGKRLHICSGDWIVYRKDGSRQVVSNEVFSVMFQKC